MVMGPRVRGDDVQIVVRHTLTFPRRVSHARVMHRFALETEGAGNAGRLGRARSLACESRKHTS